MRYKIVIAGAMVLLIGLVMVPSLFAAPLFQAPPTVRIGQIDLTDYPRVTLYVNVFDENGDPIEGLRRSDFEVVEEDRSAGIVDFAGLGEQRPVDIVFVLDTTSSMGSYIEGVVENAIAFAQTLERRERDYRLGLVTFGDQVRESYSFTAEIDTFIGWMEAQGAEGGGDYPENSLEAVQQATAFSFRDDAQRLVVLITDAGPHYYGDPDDEGASFQDPRLTAEATLELLAVNTITLYGVIPNASDYGELVEATGGGLYFIYEDFTEIVTRLGQSIASQYRFTYRSPQPAADGSERLVQVTVEGETGAASYQAPTELRPGAGTIQFYSSLRSPLEISTDLVVIGTNLSLAALLALLFGLTSTIFNDTLNEHQDEIESSFVGRLFGGIKRVGAFLGRPFRAEALRGRRILTYLQVGLFLALTALVGSFLEPSFLPLSWSSVGLFFSMLLSIGLVNLAYEGSQILAARRFKLEAFLRFNPTGVLVAVACVVFSRLVGFLPGYLYGIPGGYALGSAVDLSRRREAGIAGTGLLSAGLLALLAWGLTLPTAFLQEALGATGFVGFLRGAAAGLQSLLLTVFFVGIEVVFLELFPTGPTNGATLFKWNKVVWGLAFGTTAFVALHTLFTPESTYLSGLRDQSLLLLLGVLFLYSLLTVSLWYLFEVRAAHKALGVCPSCGHENEPGTRFCVQCGTALSERRVARRGMAIVVVLGGLWAVIIGAVLLAALGVG